MGKVMLLTSKKEQAAKRPHVDEYIELQERPSCHTDCVGQNNRMALTRGLHPLWRYVPNPCGIKLLGTAFGFLFVQLLLALLLTMPAYSMARDNASKDTPKGRYVLQLAAPPDSRFCKDFTDNLNQFRNLDFYSCAPRLSPKYPQLVRPKWEQIPLDMDIAKKIITLPYNDIGWDRWLKDTETARASGEVKLWRLDADLLGNGQIETLVRLNHVWIGEHPHQYCSYIDSRQIALHAPSTDFGDIFSITVPGNGLGSDLIYDSQVKRFYLLNWNTVGSSRGHGEDFYIGRGNGFKTSGATASIMAYSVDVQGITPACWIDWVPTKHH